MVLTLSLILLLSFLFSNNENTCIKTVIFVEKIFEVGKFCLKGILAVKSAKSSKSFYKIDFTNKSQKNIHKLGIQPVTFIILLRNAIDTSNSKCWCSALKKVFCTLIFPLYRGLDGASSAIFATQSLTFAAMLQWSNSTELFKYRIVYGSRFMFLCWILTVVSCVGYAE